MSRTIVPVIKGEDGRQPDYDGDFNEAKYWDIDDNAKEYGIDKGEVSIIPSKQS